MKNKFLLLLILSVAFFASCSDDDDKAWKNIPQDEIYAVLKSYRKKKKYHRLKNGDLIYLEQESIQEIDDMMQDLHVSATDFANGSIQLPVYHSFEVDDLSNNIQHAQMKRSKNFEDTLHRLRHIKHDSFKLPDGYENILRDYQVFGYQWLKTMSAYGFGAILADDMGLGKTVQMIAVLEDEKLQNPDSISLIVTPASLIFNWQDEIHKFSNNLHCLCIHGSVAQRQNKILSMSEYDVIVTSYDYLRRDHEYYEKHVFNYIILDEAQNTTPEQMKMFLTRFGFGSKMVITGDITQIDLPNGKNSGLKQAAYVLQKTPGVGIIRFGEADVVRHEIVAAIIRAYENYDSRRQKQREADNDNNAGK